MDFALEEEGSDYELALFGDVHLTRARRPVLIQTWGAALDDATSSLLVHAS